MAPVVPQLVPSSVSSTSGAARKALDGGQAWPGRHLLPVEGPLGELFPGGGIRRGSVVAIGPALAPATNHPAGRATTVGGTASLTLAVLAAASAKPDGGWAAAVGLPGLGALAAAELGIALGRFAAVPYPGERWVSVVAALLDAVDIVAVRMPKRPGGTHQADCRRLAARARERRAILLPLGEWPGADVRLTVTSASWEGLSGGVGRLRERRLSVSTHGRGAAGRPRTVELWLPPWRSDRGRTAHETPAHERTAHETPAHERTGT